MAKKVRFNMEMTAELAGFIDDLAEIEGCTRTEIIRRALSVMKAFKQQRTIGRNHLGFVSDPAKLDAEIIGVLS